MKSTTSNIPALENVQVSPAILATLSALENLNNNAFCAIDGYTTETGKVSNYLVRAATSAESVYNATLAELDEVTFQSLDLSNWIPSKGKNSFPEARGQFDYCLGVKRDSMIKTLAGDRSGTHREGHDRCSRSPMKGVTVDLVTEKDLSSGLMNPVVTSEGKYIARGVRLSCVVHSEEVLIEGEKKVVNSGSKVLMDNAIEKVLNHNRTTLRTFSLNEGKFGAIRSGSVSL